MIGNSNPTPSEILKTAKNILLIDWPDQSVPIALLDAGFQVFSYSPEGYTTTEWKVTKNEKRSLFFRCIDNPPENIDIVNVYRPEEELPDIIQNHVLQLDANVLWLHPPLTSELAKGLGEKYGLTVIQGYNIAEVAST